jgi:hypothetical protein
MQCVSLGKDVDVEKILLSLGCMCVVCCGMISRGESSNNVIVSIINYCLMMVA